MGGLCLCDRAIFPKYDNLSRPMSLKDRVGCIFFREDILKCRINIHFSSLVTEKMRIFAAEKTYPK